MTIFQKIIDGQIPADVVHRDDQCIAFRDIRPQAPVHILVIPRKAITGLAAAEPEDAPLLGHLMWVATRIAKTEGLDESGYRLIVNQGSDGGQSVFHLHVHLMGGRPLGWPPG